MTPQSTRLLDEHLPTINVNNDVSEIFPASGDLYAQEMNMDFTINRFNDLHSLPLELPPAASYVDSSNFLSSPIGHFDDVLGAPFKEFSMLN